MLYISKDSLDCEEPLERHEKSVVNEREAYIKALLRDNPDVLDTDKRLEQLINYVRSDTLENEFNTIDELFEELAFLIDVILVKSYGWCYSRPVTDKIKDRFGKENNK